jgi:hypothetical protein
MRRLSQFALGSMMAVTANLAAHTEPAVSPPPLFDATAPPHSSSPALPHSDALAGGAVSANWLVTAGLPRPLQNVQYERRANAGPASAPPPDPRPDPRYAPAASAVGLRLKLPF